ncbi:hypothetical protein D3C76_1556080 [compost metagenome]
MDLATFERGERAAIVEEAAHLAAKAQGFFLHHFPMSDINVVGHTVVIEQTDLPKIRQVPIEVPNFTL